MEPSNLIFAVIALLLVGTGIAIGLAVIAVFAMMAGLGVVSSSFVVGFWKRRTLAGVQAFFLQCGVLLGAPVGAVLAWVGCHVWPMISGEWQVLAAGAVGGAAGGLLVACLASAAAAGIAKHAWPWVRARVTVFQG
jgi:hypothetical protein